MVLKTKTDLVLSVLPEDGSSMFRWEVWERCLKVGVTRREAAHALRSLKKSGVLVEEFGWWRRR